MQHGYRLLRLLNKPLRHATRISLEAIKPSLMKANGYFTKTWKQLRQLNSKKLGAAKSIGMPWKPYSRSFLLKTLPTLVFGNSLINSICFGIL